MFFQFHAQQRQKQAWTTSNDETDSGFKRHESCQPSPNKENSVRSGRRSVGTHPARWAGRARAADRGSSMAATTSEDDMQNSENGGARFRERRRPSFPTNTSTLESASHIDRAKSFEYFPGESFPLQENSSSYEYLPGHMVTILMECYTTPWRLWRESRNFQIFIEPSFPLNAPLSL